MLILVDKITPRLEYTFDFVCLEILKIPYGFVTDKEVFIQSNQVVKWSYGIEVEGIPSLPAVHLLFERKIEPQILQKVIRGDIIPIFRAKEGIGFDVFASLFYLISRYEEYLPSVRDAHGRYAAYQSVAMEFGFIEKTMVNRYIVWFANWLKENFSTIEFKLPKWTVLYTFDVDHPYYSKDIPLDRMLARKIKNVRTIGEKDKYDTYDFILDSLKEIPSLFFFLCPKEPSENDNYNKRDNQGFKELITKIRERSKIGIHPSYYADENDLLKEEADWLSALHQRQIKSSRYHYLRNDIESSYSKLPKAGIKFDFSMAYGNQSGFRSSCSLPFYFFDVKANKKTEIIIYSPCIMDSSYEYGHMKGFDAKCRTLLDEVKNYGGVFIPIFHNDILAKEEWKEHFINSMNMIRNEI